MRTHGIFVRLEGRRCVVIGSGGAAAGKVDALLRAGAEVAVIAADPDGPLRTAIDAGGHEHQAREYRDGDLRGAFLAYACVRDRDVIARLRDEAERERVLLNVVDVPEACTFFAGARVERGALQVLVGTGGMSPAGAASARAAIEAALGGEYGPFIDILGAVRQTLAGRSERVDVLRALCESPLLELIREGDQEAVDALLARTAGGGCTLARLGIALEGAS